MRSEQTTLPVGTLLSGRYLLKNILGAGNSGTVYLVSDQSAGSSQQNIFALKEMLRLDPQERYQFTLNEKLLCQLRHPALPSIYALFSDDAHERAYMLMDYAEGVDMETLCLEQPDGHFTWFDLQKLLKPVFEALAYLHGQIQPVIHGDIKPLNLIRQTASDKVVLVDLGYAQSTTANPRRQFTSTALSNYQAPEHLTGTVNVQTDIYELGATLYMLLTGQAPIDASTRLQHIRRGEPDPLRPIHQLTPAVPRTLTEVLQRALALDPGRRFSSIQAFWQALNAEQTLATQTEPDTSILNSANATWPDELQISRDELQHSQPIRKRALHSSLLPAIAVLSAIVLVLLGISAWLLVQISTVSGKHQQSSLITPVNQPIHVTNQGTLSPTGQTGNYPNVSGVYLGTFTSLNLGTNNFSLAIKQQQGKLSGTFSSPKQNGTFTGTIDQAGNINFVVVDTAGHAIYAFTGGLNGIAQISDSMGGTFYNCAPTQNATCQQGLGSGNWALALSTAALPGQFSPLSLI